MSGFDILSLVGEPWADSGGLFRGIGVTVTDTASLPSSKFLEFVLNGASIYSVLKTGETIISNAAGTSLGGIRLAGSAGEMGLTSQIDSTTGAAGEVLRYSWEDPAHVGNDPASASVLEGMGATNFSIEGAGAITHIAGNSAYAWSGILGTRVIWKGYTAATNNGRTIDFSNVGQTSRASPVVSVSAGNAADDLIHFGLSDGSNWNVAAKIDAAGRGQFQMLDLPQQGAPGNPAASTVRIYGTSVGGVSKVAFRDSTGAETVLGSTVSVSGGTATTSTPVASFAQTWNGAGVSFTAITANVTDVLSNADSTLMDLKVNSNSVFQVSKAGAAVISGTDGTQTVVGPSGMTVAAGTVTANQPLQNLSQTWSNANVNFDAIKVSIGGSVFGGASHLINCSVGGKSAFRVRWDGTVQIGDSTHAHGGIQRVNSGGNALMTFWSQYDRTTGDPAPVFYYGWEDATLDGFTTSGIAVLKGMGANRFSIESASAMVHISDSSRFEWEGWNAPRLSFVGYVKGSSEGRTVDFNNSGQPVPSLRANPVVSFSSISNDEDVVHFGRYDGNATWTANAKVSATGLGTFPQLDLPEQASPSDPAANVGRLYSKSVAGATRLAFRDSAGSESVLLAASPSATPELIIPDATITLYDAAGNAYKVPCLAI
jgi:hypothetical protein